MDIKEPKDELPLWQNAFQSEFACPYHHILSLYFLCNHISHTLLYSHPPLHKDHVAQRDLQYITISSVMTSFWLLLWIQNWDETALILFYNCAPISSNHRSSFRNTVECHLKENFLFRILLNFNFVQFSRPFLFRFWKQTFCDFELFESLFDFIFFLKITKNCLNFGFEFSRQKY